MEYYNKKNRQTIVRGGANYGYRTTKSLQGLVWRVFEMKQINLAGLIEDNIS